MAILGALPLRLVSGALITVLQLVSLSVSPMEVSSGEAAKYTKPAGESLILPRALSHSSGELALQN
ncbi:hypothetical protein HMPREF2998_10020 [Corynebacterium sp. HMSC065A05]|nr:hypothetical protein HMPREF0307_01297 [Corynebacterium sp. DNF00584]OFP19040.1 hypothetical protein HMPREF2998_10020 [Corynebacterium sp. HMSC065A05]